MPEIKLMPYYHFNTDWHFDAFKFNFFKAYQSYDLIEFIIAFRWPCNAQFQRLNYGKTTSSFLFSSVFINIFMFAVFDAHLVNHLFDILLIQQVS